MGVLEATHWTGGLQSESLQCLAPPILDLGNHSLDWGPVRVGARARVRVGVRV